MKKKNLLRILGPLLGLSVFILAVWLLQKELRDHSPHEILAHLKGIPLRQLVPALGLTFLSYLLLTGYDALAFRYIDHPLPGRKILFASFIGYAVGNNTGSFSVIAGSGVRFRLYAAWGLTHLEIARVVAFCFLTFWLGFFFLGGLAFFLNPMVLPPAFPFPAGSLRLLGLLFLGMVTGYLLWGKIRKRPLRWGEEEFPLPSTRLSILQVLLASVDWILAASILFLLLPYSFPFSFPDFLGFFLLAQIIGLASQVPGGLGVFESMFILLLPVPHLHSATLGALVAFRLIYYFLPLAVATAMFGFYEIVVLRRVK
jgi:uncharacterized membrane protein YbhN (UPF0104 family)